MEYLCIQVTDGFPILLFGRINNRNLHLRPIYCLSFHLYYNSNTRRSVKYISIYLNYFSTYLRYGGLILYYFYSNKSFWFLYFFLPPTITWFCDCHSILWPFLCPIHHFYHRYGDFRRIATNFRCLRVRIAQSSFLSFPLAHSATISFRFSIRGGWVFSSGIHYCILCLYYYYYCQ